MHPASKKIDEKVKSLEQVIQKLRVQAKQYLAKSQATKGAQKQMYKNKALMALNKKKQYQNQMMGLMNHQMTVEKINMTTQSMKNHQQMINTLQHTVGQQKKIMQNVNVDKMADLQDEMLDMKFQADYMNQMMNRNYQIDVDQDQLDDQLAQFERQIAMDKKKTVNTNKPQTQTQDQSKYKNQDIQSMLKGL